MLSTLVGRGLVAAARATTGPSGTGAATGASTATAGRVHGVDWQRASGPARRPNIVVVMADDMRVDELLFMPNLRRLVGRHGLTVRNSFSPFPLCCPPRAS